MTAPVDPGTRRVALLFIGALAIGMAAVIAYDGADGVRLPIYTKVALLPWWAWAIWSAVNGVLLALGLIADRRHLYLTALAGAVAWWALRWGLLALGAIETGPPHAGAVSYAFIVGIHVLALLLEVWPGVSAALDRRTHTRAARRG